MRDQAAFTDLMAVLNIIVAGAIFVLFVCYRSKLFEQSKLEGWGLNLMAIASFIILVKTTQSMFTGGVNFDVFGLLFRAGYLMYLGGNLLTSRKVGVSVVAKEEKSHVYVGHSDTVKNESSHNIHIAST